MAVSVTLSQILTVVETLSSSVDAVTTPVLTHSSFNISGLSLDGSTTPAAQKVAAALHTLTAGSKVIDLTALTGANGAAIDGTGLKLRAILIVNPTSNSLTVAADGTNGYLLFGASGSVIIPAGGSLLFYPKDGAPTVGASAKRILLTGTGTDQHKVVIVLG